MGDFALHLETTDDGLVSIDMRLVNDDIESDEGMRTAVLLSLFPNRRAEPDDVLPSDDGDRGGWWGDKFAKVKGDLIGSRLYLLDRSKRTSNVDSDAEEFARESLVFMVEDHVAENDVESADGFLGVTIHRPETDPMSLRFAHVWAGEAAR